MLWREVLVCSGELSFLGVRSCYKNLVNINGCRIPNKNDLKREQFFVVAPKHLSRICCRTHHLALQCRNTLLCVLRIITWHNVMCSWGYRFVEEILSSIFSRVLFHLGFSMVPQVLIESIWICLSCVFHHNSFLWDSVLSWWCISLSTLRWCGRYTCIVLLLQAN